VFAHKNGGVRVVEQIAGKVRQLQNDLFGDVGVPFCRDKNFSNRPNSVHYVLAAVSMAASGNVDATISVTTTGTPVFVYNLQPDNTCVYPAHVRFLLQQKGDDLSGRNGKQYFSWWSNSVAYQLAPGQAQLRASLTDLSQWTSVLGEKANTSAAATAALRKLSQI
jgi:hypothetical protein